MDAKFWHKRWAKNEIGFHQPGYNSHLESFAGKLAVNPGDRFLVPLCGKSLDLLWLAEQGFRVTGIELSERAARDFFTENKLEFEVSNIAGMPTYSSSHIDIHCADFFSFRANDLPPFDAIYDRAALVALPTEMRRTYANHLAQLIRPGTDMLLITLDYPQEEMKGPPFSVTRAEVRGLFERQFSIRQLFSEDCLVKEPRFKAKGLSRMEEHVFLLRKTAGLEQK
jgi:thiopurine S-methyltransferase